MATREIPGTAIDLLDENHRVTVASISQEQTHTNDTKNKKKEWCAL